MRLRKMCIYNVYIYGVLLSTCVVAGRPVKIGILCSNNPNSWEYLFGIASAINIAQDKLIEQGIIQNGSISSIVWKDTRTQADGLGNLVDLVNNENVDVIFGSPLSEVSHSVGHLTSYWNIPQVIWRGNSLELSNKALYTTLVRTIGPMSESGLAIVSLFKKYKWERIGLLYTDHELCEISAIGLKASFGEHNLTVMQSITFPINTTLTDGIIVAYLKLLKQSSRIIFLCPALKNIGRFVRHACRMSMCDGTYVFIYTALYVPRMTALFGGISDDAEVRQGTRHMIVVTTAEWRNETDRKWFNEFRAQVVERMIEPPWYFNYSQMNKPASPGSQNLYEAMYLYGMWWNYTSEHGLDVKDGAAWLEFSKNKSFKSITLPCNIGVNGDRLPYFWFQQYIGEERSDLQIVAISEDMNTIISETGGFRWYTHDGKPPPDSPVCGFFEELCEDNQQDDTFLVLVSALTTLSLLVLALFIGYIIRKRKLEEVLLQRIWKIRLDDIEMYKARSAARLTSQSNISAMSQDGCTAPNVTPMTSVAKYKGQTVALRHVTRLTELTKLDMHFLKTMREIQHDNVNPFLGACFDTPSPFILFHYCPKGSLQDILENDEIKLDANFKYSLTMDLVQGILYIHNSKLGSHSRLKSSNCLVDNRWMLKVSDFGPASFMNRSTEQNMDNQQKYKSMLWTAPELITGIGHNCNGSKEGDVYSLGIIMHEIFYRMGPFAGNEHMTVDEIIHQVQTRDNNPCRPVTFTSNNDVAPAVVKLMKLCWHDNASERPSFSSIRSFMKKNIQQGWSVNIVDVILQRLEKYASNLEELVDQRTQQLVYEKQKSDKLLYKMLPKTCADKLKAGEQVLPEVFESATVFFSDIVGFTVISCLSTPIEVVDLLNDLYMCFDSIINKYDAYKVETIGDAYLVVSGIPTRNDNRHAGIIADMSLDIVAAVERFKIKHLPTQIVRVRIGCHSGPCCAGIVGLSMPKYCLFGDTVNTASRMESNGEAQKIHLSEAMYCALNKIGGYAMTFRAEMEIKGKGLMRTYWLESHDCSSSRIMSTGHLQTL